jgi:hypothetical protein
MEHKASLHEPTLKMCDAPNSFHFDGLHNPFSMIHKIQKYYLFHNVCLIL